MLPHSSNPPEAYNYLEQPCENQALFAAAAAFRETAAPRSRYRYRSVSLGGQNRSPPRPPNLRTAIRSCRSFDEHTPAIVNIRLMPGDFRPAVVSAPAREAAIMPDHIARPIALNHVRRINSARAGGSGLRRPPITQTCHQRGLGCGRRGWRFASRQQPDRLPHLVVIPPAGRAEHQMPARSGADTPRQGVLQVAGDQFAHVAAGWYRHLPLAP